MDPFVPLPVGIFFYLFFWTNSRFKQEHKAIYTVSNEKHEARLPPFFLFLISFFPYHLFSSSLSNVFLSICVFKFKRYFCRYL